MAKSAGSAAAVQVLADGTTRIETVIENSTAPHRFTYTFGAGVTPTLRADGRVDLISGVGATTTTLGQVARAWAFDANGSAVPTDYSVVDGALVQTVHTNADTAYPVVADPSVSFGWAVYYTYSQAEVRSAAQQTPYFVLSNVVCGVAGAGLGAGVCASVMGFAMTSIDRTFQSAAANGQCVQISLPYYPSAVTLAAQMRWKAISC